VFSHDGVFAGLVSEDGPEVGVLSGYVPLQMYAVLIGGRSLEQRDLFHREVERRVVTPRQHVWNRQTDN